MLRIRKAEPEDFDVIMSIYRIAQDFMISTGNPNQWKHTNPTPEQVKQDMADGICHVMYDDSGIHGVFALLLERDSIYDYIEDGEWLNDEPYVTIHRIAGDQTVRGVLKTAVEHAKKFGDNIRIDTHHDNKVMQGAIAKNGFKRCGIIYLKNGDPRIAFQWCRE